MLAGMSLGVILGLLYVVLKALLVGALTNADCIVFFVLMFGLAFVGIFVFREE